MRRDTKQLGFAWRDPEHPERGGRDRFHVAINMDGNGRWALARGRLREEGHVAGAAAVRRTVEAAPSFGDHHSDALRFLLRQLAASAARRAAKTSTQAFRAWDFFHLGMKHLYNATCEDNDEAQRLFRSAANLDRELAEAYAWLSYCTGSRPWTFTAG